MRKLPIAVLVLAAAPSLGWAEDLIVIKPGIMCRSRAALAALTIHGGDSRTHRNPPSAQDLTVARIGGCQDLSIGQTLRVVKAFRNTLEVVDPGGNPDQASSGILVAPSIDLGPVSRQPVSAAEAAPQDEQDEPEEPEQAQEDDPMSDVALNALIGTDEGSFLRMHPGGMCVQNGPGRETCAYNAGSYSTGNQADCPFMYACTNAIYGFHDGRLTSYQVGLHFEYEWKRAYNAALAHYGRSISVSNATGASAFFRTKAGILAFGHTSGRPGRPPTWAIRYYLPGEGPEPTELRDR
jgi:hypothetical protein